MDLIFHELNISTSIGNFLQEKGIYLHTNLQIFPELNTKKLNFLNSTIWPTDNKIFWYEGWVQVRATQKWVIFYSKWRSVLTSLQVQMDIQFKQNVSLELTKRIRPSQNFSLRITCTNIDLMGISEISESNMGIPQRPQSTHWKK